MATLERETIESANLGGANMRVVRGGHFWQLGTIASLARETTGWEILVAVWPKHGLKSDTVTHSRISFLLISRRLTRPRVALRIGPAAMVRHGRTGF